MYYSTASQISRDLSAKVKENVRIALIYLLILNLGTHCDIFKSDFKCVYP